MTAPLLLLTAYLVGAIPFGYVIGRLRGVNLFHEGSGNIGATNAGRVLGRKFGLLVFVLDFLKGSLPVAAVGLFERELESPNAVRAGVAALAFLGHLFPIYLGFRGGKGVATGAGTVVVLAPIPATCAIAAWIVVALASRTVSLASIVAVAAIVAVRLVQPAPFASEALPITLYLAIGATVVILKHRSNIGRLRAGTEGQLRDFAMRETLVRGLHIIALGLWFGSAAFFNLVSAPRIFQSFDAVANAGPSDRTAHVDIAKGLDSEERKRLGSALAGAAVGPIFPAYYVLQVGCCGVALATAFSWWKRPGRVNRLRVWILLAAMVVVSVSVPLGMHVSEIRVLRFDPDAAIREKAKADFATWHLVSLLLSLVTVVQAGLALASAAALPDRNQAASTAP